MTEKQIVSIDSSAGDFLKKFSKTLEGYAVRKYDSGAFLKSAMLAIVNSDILSECLMTEKGTKSLYNSMRYAASTGLSLNPSEGEAALIAYRSKNEVVINYQIMKNGMITIAMESGKVESLQADYVKENDTFILKKTASGDDYDFSPALKERGEVIGFYASLKMTNGMTHVKWMTKDEIEKHRDTYSIMYKKNQENSPWHKSPVGMGLKTVIKALLSTIKISKELDSALQSDDFIDADFTISPGMSANETADKLKKKIEKKEGGGDLL